MVANSICFTKVSECVAGAVLGHGHWLQGTDDLERQTGARRKLEDLVPHCLELAFVSESTVVFKQRNGVMRMTYREKKQTESYRMD